MWLIALRQRVRTTMGRVADFCRLCRTVRPFRLIRISMVESLYGVIRFGVGEILGFEVECPACRGCWPVDAKVYSGVLRRGWQDLAKLVERTHPDLAEHHRARIAGDRTRAIEEALAAAGEWAGVRTRDLDVDLPVALIFVATIGAPSLVLWHDVAQPHSSGLAGGLALGGVVALVWAIASVRRRFVRRRVLPPLARSLAPLGLREEELRAAAERLAGPARAGLARVSPDELLDRIGREAPDLDGPDELDWLPAPGAGVSRGRRLREALASVDASSGARLDHVRIDLPVLGSCAATLALFASPCVVPGGLDWPLAGILWGAAFASILAAVVVLGRSPRRAALDRIRPELVRALAPLEPTLEELKDALGWLSVVGLRVGKLLRPRAVLDALDSRSRGPVA